MDELVLKLFVTGVVFLLIQIYWEIHMRTDDRFIAKKTSEEILDEIKHNEKRNSYLVKISKITRVFIIKRYLLIMGILIIFVTLILKIFI